MDPESIATGAADGGGNDAEEADAETLKHAATKQWLKSIGFALGIHHEPEDEDVKTVAACHEAMTRHFDNEDDEE